MLFGPGEFAFLTTFWNAVKTPLAIVGSVASIVSVIALILQVWRNRQLQREERRWRQFVLVDLERDLNDFQRLLATILLDCDHGEWQLAYSRTTEAKHTADRMIANPLLSYDEKNEIHETADNLEIIGRYFMDAKINKAAASPTFDRKKQRELRVAAQLARRVLRRIHELKWRGLK